jgi:hypothetical protein
MGRTCGTHGTIRHAYTVLVRNPEGRGYLEYLCIDGRIILK